MTQLTLSDGTPALPFAFGTMQFGGTADEAECRAMYDACRAAGITHFDSAWAYNGGRSEEILGRLAGAERDKVYIATKIAFPGGGAEAFVRQSFDTSRKRLNMDVIDLIYMHRWTDDVPLDETFAALADLQARGQVRHIGVSNYAAWQVMKAQAVAQRLGTRIDVIQPMYSLVKRQAEVEMLPMCASEGITACTYSPLGGGLLTGKYTEGAEGRLKRDAMYAARYAPEALHAAAAQLKAIAAETGEHPATLAVAWVARHSARPHPILSARSAAQLAPSLAGMAFAMDDALYARLCTLVPTPPPATDRLEEA